MPRRNVVGVIERRDPIPPGTYWVDIVSPSFEQYRERREAFARWRKQNASTVEVLQEQESPRVAPTYYSTAHHRWVLFKLTGPTPRWPVSAGLGLPTVATKGEATKKEDTMQRPPPESPWGELAGAAGAIGFFVVLYLLSRSK